MTEQLLTSRFCGQAAEHLVCYDLAKRGVSAVSNPIEGAPYDIVADYKGFLIRIQVKGTIAPKTSHSYKMITSTGEIRKYPARPKYRFHVKQSQLNCVELIAFVAVDIGTILYKRTEDISETSSEIRVGVEVMQTGCDAAISRLLSDLDNLGGF